MSTIEDKLTALNDAKLSIMNAINDMGGEAGLDMTKYADAIRGLPGGKDGFSPVVTVTKEGDTVTITITDKNGTTTATVKDGAAGNPSTAIAYSLIFG